MSHWAGYNRPGVPEGRLRRITLVTRAAVASSGTWFAGTRAATASSGTWFAAGGAADRPRGRCGGSLAGVGRSVGNWAMRGAGGRGGAAEEGGKAVAGAGGGGHGDRRGEQGVPAGAGDQDRRDHQQVGGQCGRDRPASTAGPGDVPAVHGDLEGGRGGQEAGCQRAAGDLDDLARAARARPGVEQVAGTIAEGPGRVGHQVIVLGGGVQADLAGFDARTDRGQEFRGHGRDYGQRVADRGFEQPGAFGRPGRRGGIGHRAGPAGTRAAVPGATGGRPKVATRPGSLNEVIRVMCDAAMVNTWMAWARYTPSGSRR